MSQAGNGDRLTKNGSHPLARDDDPRETAEWLESLDYVIQSGGPQRAAFLLERLKERAFRRGVPLRLRRHHALRQHHPRRPSSPPIPGDREIERKSRASSAGTPWPWWCGRTSESQGIGGHISTYASAATLYEVAFNHFFHGKRATSPRRPGLFPGPRRAGHLRPGVPARPAERAALEKLPPRAGPRRRAVVLSASLADARLLGVSHRLDGPGRRSWPSTRPGSIITWSIAASSPTPQARGSGPSWATANATSPRRWGPSRWPRREQLDNLIFVINCNLQRLDGPVRGNGKIIQELEGAFRGAGWNVIKVIWGSNWDPLLASDTRRPAGPPHGRGRRRRVSEIHRHARRVHPRALLRRRSAAAGDGRPT